VSDETPREGTSSVRLMEGYTPYRGKGFGTPLYAAVTDEAHLSESRLSTRRHSAAPAGI